MAFRKLQHLSYNYVYSKPLLINFAIKDFDNVDVKHVHDHVNLFSVILFPFDGSLSMLFKQN